MFEAASDLTEAVNGRAVPLAATPLGRVLRDLLVAGQFVVWPGVGEIGTRVPARGADRKVWFWFHPDFVARAVQRAQSKSRPSGSHRR